MGGSSNKTQLDQFKIEMFRGEGKYTKTRQREGIEQISLRILFNLSSII